MLKASVKEDVINRTQAHLGPWKAKITQSLVDKGIKVILSNFRDFCVTKGAGICQVSHKMSKDIRFLDEPSGRAERNN